MSPYKGEMSTLYYAITSAEHVFRKLKTAHEDLHDGAGEDEVVGQITLNLIEAIHYFEDQYLTPDSHWNDGVYDYDVWDTATSAHGWLFYELLVRNALSVVSGRCGLGDKPFIGGVHNLVDAYAFANGWKVGMGGKA